MKIILSLLIFCSLFAGCKNTELSPKYLSNITVVRKTGENQNTPKENVSTSSGDHTSSAYTRPAAGPSTRYHIIVASFSYSQKAKAERLVKQLQAKNYPATLLNSSQRFRVSIESFATEAEANTARDEYRYITDRQDIWVHKVN